MARLRAVRVIPADLLPSDVDVSYGLAHRHRDFLLCLRCLLRDGLFIAFVAVLPKHDHAIGIVVELFNSCYCLYLTLAD